jgi:hypothetical protein
VKKTFFLCVLCVLCGYSLSAQDASSIQGELDWERMTLSVTITLDMEKEGIVLPGGRAEAEEILLSEYIRLARPVILNMPVDSSRTVGDLLSSGQISTGVVDDIAMAATRVPPALSSDLRTFSASRTIDLKQITPWLTVGRGKTARIPPGYDSEAGRTSTQIAESGGRNMPYTGILIIAWDSLPEHGKSSAAYAVPCLFPKIWDSGMNLIYPGYMESADGRRTVPSWTDADSIFVPGNSFGISAELAQIIGERPLRIFAKGVYGERPCDIIIDKEDAFSLLSNSALLGFLKEGKTAIALDRSVLVTSVQGE